MTALFQTDRHDGHDFVAVDNFAGVINGKATVGIAIVGDSKICVVLEDGRLQSTQVSRAVSEIDVVAVWVCTDYDNLCAGVNECLRRYARCCAVRTIENDLETVKSVWQGLEQMNDVAVFRISETCYVTNRAANWNKFVCSHKRFDFVFDLIVELVAAACEKLDAVIGCRVVRCRNHYAEVGIHVGG